MKDLTSTSFGYVIAFLLPGLAAIYGIVLCSDEIRRILKPAITFDATLGPSLILLLVALGAGLCISAIRCLFFERWICRRHRFPADMFSKLSSRDKLGSFKAVVDEHYRYHQFYGGCFIALIGVYPGWIRVSYPVSIRVFLFFSLCFALFEWLLFETAVDAYKKYVERGNIIVRGHETAIGASHRS